MGPPRRPQGADTVTLLHDRLSDLPSCDDVARAAIHERAANILRPSGALAWLDDIAEWVGGWQRTDRPRIERPVGLIFAADHGVAAATKVSAYPTGVTEAMFAAYQQGRSTINAFARVVGAEVTAIDVGIGDPTGDIRYEAALSPERFDDIVATAFDAVDGLDGDLLVLGEMGIGNTTPSAAIAAALAGGETAAWVGRGTGIDDDGLARKRGAVQESVRRIAGITDPLEILREVGGAELVAVAAATVAARRPRTAGTSMLPRGPVACGATSSITSQTSRSSPIPAATIPARRRRRQPGPARLAGQRRRPAVPWLRGGGRDT